MPAATVDGRQLRIRGRRRWLRSRTVGLVANRQDRHFYEYEPPRPLDQIEHDIEGLEKEIMAMLKEVTA
jgi:hypothetical protein